MVRLAEVWKGLVMAIWSMADFLLELGHLSRAMQESYPKQQMDHQLSLIVEKVGGVLAIEEPHELSILARSSRRHRRFLASLLLEYKFA